MGGWDRGRGSRRGSSRGSDRDRDRSQDRYINRYRDRYPPWKELRMQKRNKMTSESGPKFRKPRPQVVPNRQLRPQILRKATRILLHSSKFWIFPRTRKSMTKPEKTTTARKVRLVK